MSKNTKTEPRPLVIQMRNLLECLTADAAAAHEAWKAGRPRGPVTGMPGVDHAIGRYFAPGLHVVQAAPGGGKTALALQTLADCHCQSLYISVEMSILELFRRLVSRTTGTFLGKLKSGELPPEEIQRLGEQTANTLSHATLVDATHAAAGPEFLAELIRELKQRDHHGHALVVVDSLHAWGKQVFAGFDEYDMLDSAAMNLEQFGLALGVPIIAIAHRNRVANKSGKGGGLHGSKGNGAIEYYSETVIDLEPVDDTIVADERAITLTVSKNRNGVPGRSCALFFNGALQSFRESATNERPPARQTNGIVPDGGNSKAEIPTFLLQTPDKTTEAPPPAPAGSTWAVQNPRNGKRRR